MYLDGYSLDDVMYEWDGEVPVKKSLDITMAQFSLTFIKHSASNLTLHNNWGIQQPA